MDSDHLFVITGGPGPGKSTLLECAGRAWHLQHARSRAGDHSGPVVDWRPSLALARSRRFRRTDVELGNTIASGYLRFSGLPIPADIDRAARIFRYHQRVFVALPWPEIFTPDAERKQSFERAQAT